MAGKACELLVHEIGRNVRCRLVPAQYALENIGYCRLALAVFSTVDASLEPLGFQLKDFLTLSLSATILIAISESARLPRKHTAILLEVRP